MFSPRVMPLFSDLERFLWWECANLCQFIVFPWPWSEAQILPKSTFFADVSNNADAHRVCNPKTRQKTIFFKTSLNLQYGKSEAMQKEDYFKKKIENAPRKIENVARERKRIF